jgi:hypothetical protein
VSETRGARAGDQLPVSAHPAFPVIVALWFAALLGLGSLVLPSVLIERIVVAVGLPSVLDAAQPPLGVTARIATALIATAFGAAAGLVIARRVVAANAPKPTRRAATLQRAAAGEGMSAKRPISAHEELGEEGLEAAPAEPARPTLAGRRRALTAEEGARSEFLDFAPLPGQAAAPPLEPLDLEMFAETEPGPEPEADEDASVVAERAAGDPHAQFGTASLSERRPFAQPAEIAMPTPAPMPYEPPVRAHPVADDIPEQTLVSSRPISELAIVELVERFALALQRHQADSNTAAAESKAEPAPLVLPRLGATAPTEDDYSAVVSNIPAALLPIDFEDDDTDEDAVHPLGGFDLSSALRSQDRPFDAPARVEIDADEPEADEPEEVAEESYPSLLAMKSPLGTREPVRIDEPNDADAPIEPVVVFPGHNGRRAAPAADGPSRDVGPRAFDRPDFAAAAAPSAPTQPFAPARADAGETEKALREALEKLQRLSGAA